MKRALLGFLLIAVACSSKKPAKAPSDPELPPDDDSSEESKPQRNEPSTGSTILRVLGGAAGGAAAGARSRPSGTDPPRRGDTCRRDADCPSRMLCSIGDGKRDGVCVDQ